MLLISIPPVTRVGRGQEKTLLLPLPLELPRTAIREVRRNMERLVRASPQQV